MQHTSDKAIIRYALEKKRLNQMVESVIIRAKLNIKKNKRRGRIYDNKGENFKEHKQRESWYRIVKNPFIRIFDGLEYKERLKDLQFAFTKIELFARYQRH